MLKLKNVSKFYYNKGVVASGFNKVNLELNMGEFIVITGESGSGKSTLLNVISGLDTYEEGEMYINGEETSHYGESDFESYRKKYIGNIFQNFNLVNSYTVYQNVELILLLNGYTGKDCKKKVLEILNKVGLLNFKSTKVSKLSGGQKQRVAIARALAKDTPIIVADEPTGNLDSVSAKEVMRLLYEISKEKLVIIVTHNYDQVEEYATRKIRMHDGKVIEDKILKQEAVVQNHELTNYKNIRLFNKIRIGVRNTFNIFTKFILLFLVYVFITFAVSAEYSTLQKQKEVTESNGYNSFFLNKSDKRIVLKKEDNSTFTENDYSKIGNMNNIDKIFKNDLLLDTMIMLTDNDFNFYGNVLEDSFLEGTLDIGEMPINENEIIIEGNKNDYYIKTNDIIGKEFEIRDENYNKVGTSKVKVVGIKYNKEINYNYKFYVKSKIIDDLRYVSNSSFSTVETLLNEVIYKSDIYNSYFKVVSNPYVPMGEAYVSEDISYACYKEKCISNYITVTVNNLFYSESKNLIITKTYNKNSYKSLIGLDDYEYNNGQIYINTTDYNNLFNKDNYQSSVFVIDKKLVRETMEELENNGFNTMYVSDSMIKQDEYNQVLDIIRTVVVVILIVVLFFISYFIIKLILKSRNIYFSTIRMLGASKKVCNDLLKIDLLTVINISFIFYIGFILLVKYDYITFDYIKNLITYLNAYNYVIIYIVLVVMSYFIANRYSRKLFKKSAMKTYRGDTV